VILLLSRRARDLPRSAIRTAAERAGQTRDVVRLDIGDPDFATPPHVVEAVARAATGGLTHYGPSAGLPSLRAALAARLIQDGASAPERVVVTVGAAGALFCGLLALTDPGDEVLLPDPGWAGLPSLVHAAGLASSFYPLDPATGFEPDLDALDAAIGPRTRVVVLNTPGNPTGAVFSRRAVERVAEITASRGVWLMADECYEQLVFEGEHVSVAESSPAPETVLRISSFSKTYAMTGWRVGYAVGDPAVIDAIARIQEAELLCPPTPTQKGAEAALLGPQDVVATMRDAYRARRDLAMATLDSAGIPFVRPGGAFYLLAGTGGEPSLAFADRLLAEQRVAVVAGAAFGAGGEGFVRVSLAAYEDALARGLGRLADAVPPSLGATPR